jgi:hypothetical protein
MYEALYLVLANLSRFPHRTALLQDRRSEQERSASTLIENWEDRAGLCAHNG